MAGPKLYDRVKETTTISGNGTLTLAGATFGNRTFSVVGNTNSAYYCIEHQTANEWEVGVGTWATGNTLTRDKILASSNTGSLVSLSVGTKNVFLTAPASILEPDLDAGGRLTATSATGITTSDVNGATTIYYTPHIHNRIAIYNGYSWQNLTFSEITIDLSSHLGNFTAHFTPTGNTTNGSAVVTNLSNNTATMYIGEPFIGDGGTIQADSLIASVDSSSQVTLTKTATATTTGSSFIILHANYDIFLYNNNGTVAVYAATNVGNWTSNSARNLSISKQDGVWVLTADSTKRYIGTFRLVGNNKTEDSLTRRYMWNVENRAIRPIRKYESTASWTYGTATFRPWNNSTANRMEFIRGLDEDVVSLSFHGLTTGTAGYIAFGLDSTSVVTGQMNVSSNYVSSVPFSRTLGLGYHYVQLLEKSAGGGTTTFYGVNTGELQYGAEGFCLS